MGKQDKVRVALIGIGSWAGVIANAVQRSQKLEMAACYSRNPEKRAAFSTKYGCDQAKSFEDVIKRSDIDGVLLTTPNNIHAEHALLAAKEGKHVYVEKPIANTMADGRKMVAACRDAGVTLLVGHDMRRLAGFRKMKEMIDQGAIGKPVMVEANFSARLGFELTPDKVGTYAGKCAELCGVDHARMLFNVRVVERAEFDQYIADLKARGQSGLLDTGMSNDDGQMPDERTT